MTVDRKLHLMWPEPYPDFRSASEEAKELARRFKETVGVRRDGDFWELVMSDRIRGVLLKNLSRDIAEVEADLESERRAEEAEAAEYESGYESPEQEIYRKETEELVAELSDDCDDYARSEEEGWMYPD